MQAIKQKASSDCFVASLAMACGLTYDEAAGKLDAEFLERIQEHGTYDRDIGVLFEALDLEEGVHYRKLYLIPEWATVGFARNALWGRRACIQVRSKNVAEGMHIVYWDGSALHDPSNLRTYEWSEVEPIVMWLFHENLDA